jgi:transcriptional regulator with XRE-family HTH domain
VDAGGLIKSSRLAAGLTQTELAARLGTTQSAVARLERPDSNPRLDTLERALHAADHGLEMRVRRQQQSVDDSQIAERLKLSPAERLAAFRASSQNMDRLLAKAGRQSARAR